MNVITLIIDIISIHLLMINNYIYHREKTLNNGLNAILFLH